MPAKRTEPRLALPYRPASRSDVRHTWAAAIKASGTAAKAPASTCACAHCAREAQYGIKAPCLQGGRA